jgi:hypothetical protein
MHHKNIEIAGPGDNCGFNIKGLDKLNMPRSGDIMVLKKDLTLKRAKSFTAQVQVLDHPGELKKGYTPIGCVRTAHSAVRLTDIKWKMGKETVCHPELEFAWATSSEIDWNRLNIFHNAGVTSPSDGLFYKALLFIHQINYFSQIIWKKNDLQRSFTFSTFEKLFFLIDKILKKKKLIKQLVESNCNKFYNSSILIENELNKVFLD